MTAETQTFSEARLFMPGACGPEGEAAAIFAESDIAPDSRSPAVALAQAACNNCLQLSYCRDQLHDISSTLVIRGVGIPVVAAEIVPEVEAELEYATQRERLKWEPHYKFDLSRPLPRDTRTAIVIIRQMLCENHKLISGVTSMAAKWAIDLLYQDTDLQAFTDGLELADAEIDQVIGPLAQLLVAHNKQEEGISDSRFRRLPFDRQIDPEILRKMAPHYLHDASQVKDMGFSDLNIVLFHEAAYWRRLVDSYADSHCISPVGVVRYCQKRPRDPTPSIEAHIEKTTLRREGRYHDPYVIPAAIRQAEVARLESELAQDYPYISRAMIQTAFHRSSTVRVAIGKVEALKRPSIASVIADFKGRIIETALTYAVMHTGDARQWIADYVDRIQTLANRVAEAGGSVPPSMLEAYAIDPSSEDSTGKEIINSIATKSLHRTFSQRCRTYRSTMHVPHWAVGKIVDHYPEEEHWDLVTNLNELMETNVLQVSHLTCALETEAADVPGFLDRAVGKHGAFVTFTADAITQYDDATRATIIQRARLDPLVYGRKLPEKPTLADIDLPLWLRPIDMATLDTYIRRGKQAERILAGEADIPKEILDKLGWPHNRDAKTVAMSAIRTTVLRARLAKRAKARASTRAARTLDR